MVPRKSLNESRIIPHNHPLPERRDHCPGQDVWYHARQTILQQVSPDRRCHNRRLGQNHRNRYAFRTKKHQKRVETEWLKLSDSCRPQRVGVGRTSQRRYRYGEDQAGRRRQRPGGSFPAHFRLRDRFKTERSKDAIYQTRRIHGMCRRFKIELLQPNGKSDASGQF